MTQVVTALTRLRKKLQAIIASNTSYVAGNAVSSWEDYKFATGEINAYSNCLNDVEDAIKETAKDADDEEFN